MSYRFGLLLACGIVLLGSAAAARSETWQSAADALRGLGSLLTVVTGLFSAVWWHQSAGLPDRPCRSDQERIDNQRDANVLNGAAATTTGLALLGGVYSGLAWSSPEGILDAVAFLLLLAMSGGELRQATKLSLRHGLRPRSALAIAVLGIAALIFAVRRLVL